MCAIVEFLRSNSQQRILGLAARNKLITYILITRAKAMQSTGEEEKKPQPISLLPSVRKHRLSASVIIKSLTYLSESRKTQFAYGITRKIKLTR